MSWLGKTSEVWYIEQEYMVWTVKLSMVRTSMSVGTMIDLGSRSVPISRGWVQIQRQIGFRE